MSLALIAHPPAILAGITLDPIAKPIAAVLAFFYGLIPNYGVAIILLTFAVMIILTPLTIKQTRSMLVMQKLQPELKRLQAEHKNDRQALNEAVMALYKEHNASPFGGCLPMLLPFPVFFALFRVLEGLSRMIKNSQGKLVSDPKYLTHSTQMYIDIQRQGGTLKAFGMDLSKSALSIKGSVWASLPFFVLLLLMVGTQYYQQRQLTSRNPQAAQGQQAQMMKFFPLIFGVISIRFPAGVVVYWTVSNSIRIFQQWAMYRYDPKVKALVEADVKEVEAKTREIDAKPLAPRPRLRDLLSGAGNPPNSTEKSPTKPVKGPAGRPNSAKGGASGKGVPHTGKAVQPGAKAVPPGRRGQQPAERTSGGKTQPRPAANKQQPVRPGDKPVDAKAATNGRGQTTGKPVDGMPGDRKAANGETVDARPTTPTPVEAQTGVNVAKDASVNGGSDPSADGTATDATSDAPKSRTGAGAPRATGNRGKRTRRGR